jgi:hypothetical protein
VADLLVLAIALATVPAWLGPAMLAVASLGAVVLWRAR